MKTRGFTLLELAIGLVIIGLIIGAILTGRSMIRVAELERVMDAKTQLLSAINLFQARFSQWPGDYDNFNGALRAADNTAVAGGDGNGIISYTGVTPTCPADTWCEVNNVYVQLGAAEMIGRAYNAANLAIDCSPSCSWVVGTDSPQGPDSNTVFWVGAQQGSFYGRTALSVNTIMLTGADMRQGSVKLEDAVALDTKYDDGQADTGEIRAYQPSGGAPGGNSCVNTASLPASASYLNPNAVAGSTVNDCVMELGTF